MTVWIIIFSINMFTLTPVSASLVDWQNEPQCSSRFDYEYKVVQKLVDLENANKEQKQKLTDLENANKEQKQINEEIMKKHAQLESEVDNTRNVASECRQANDELKDALEVLNNTIQSFHGFSAYDSTTKSPTKGSSIVFRRTQLNEGDLYNTETGQFTVPVDGIYVFHATLCTHSPDISIYAAFMGDKEVLGMLASSEKDYNSCHSGSALARLQKGSKVYLQVTYISSGPVLFDDKYHMNSFSGFLVAL